MASTSSPKTPHNSPVREPPALRRPVLKRQPLSEASKQRLRARFQECRRVILATGSDDDLYNQAASVKDCVPEWLQAKLVKHGRVSSARITQRITDRDRCFNARQQPDIQHRISWIFELCIDGHEHVMEAHRWEGEHGEWESFTFNAALHSKEELAQEIRKNLAVDPELLCSDIVAMILADCAFFAYRHHLKVSELSI